METTNYMEIMKQDYPKDFADDSEFTAALLDTCENAKKNKNLKTYLLYVRQYNMFANENVLKIYKVTTDNVYRIIGKMHCTALEQIERIDYNTYLEERENFWKEKGYTINRNEIKAGIWRECPF